MKIEKLKLDKGNVQKQTSIDAKSRLLDCQRKKRPELKSPF